MGRPKEHEKRVRIDVTILRGTLKKIDNRKIRGNRSMNSRGKVIDKLAEESV